MHRVEDGFRPRPEGLVVILGAAMQRREGGALRLLLRFGKRIDARALCVQPLDAPVLRPRLRARGGG
eukprot:1732365-Prymnesium_polylepis.1